MDLDTHFSKVIGEYVRRAVEPEELEKDPGIVLGEKVRTALPLELRLTRDIESGDLHEYHFSTQEEGKVESTENYELIGRDICLTCLTDAISDIVINSLGYNEHGPDEIRFIKEGNQGYSLYLKFDEVSEELIQAYRASTDLGACKLPTSQQDSAMLHTLS